MNQTAEPSKIMLSVISPFYNEGGKNAAGIAQYFDTMLGLLEGVRLDGQSIDFEIICIDDGSNDDTLALLGERARQDERIKVLGLSRNFGKEAAVSAGLDFCCGDAAIPFDADLQHPPGLIPQMLQLWHDSHKNGLPFHVILPIRAQRKADSLLKRSTAALLYNLMQFLSDSPIPKQAADFRLLDRKAIDAVKAMREKNRFMKGILSWPGFRTKTINYDLAERKHGKAKQNYAKLFSLALDGIFGFSVAPLRLFLYLGMLVLGGAFVLMLHTLIGYFRGVAAAGFPSLMLTMLFLNGINLLGIGIVGEYIGRIYRETKNRPIYVIEQSVNLPQKPDEPRDSFHTKPEQ